MLSVPSRWLATMGAGAKVVLLDTGFCNGFGPSAMTFPQEVRTFLPQPVEDTPGHGSRVSACIASRDALRPGVAPACILFVAQVIGPGSGWHSYEKALDWAIEIQADVVNLSFAYEVSYQGVADRLLALANQGALIFAAYNPHLAYPHSHKGVVSVGEWGTNAPTDLKASGTCPQYDPVDFRGTSVACAIVSGLAACGWATGETDWAKKKPSP